MVIRVKDLETIMALFLELRSVEDAISKSEYKIGYSYMTIAAHKDGKKPGEKELHKEINYSLRRYRKAIIDQLKTYGADYESGEVIEEGADTVFEAAVSGRGYFAN